MYHVEQNIVRFLRLAARLLGKRRGYRGDIVDLSQGDNEKKIYIKKGHAYLPITTLRSDRSSAAPDRLWVCSSATSWPLPTQIETQTQLLGTGRKQRATRSQSFALGADLSLLFYPRPAPCKAGHFPRDPSDLDFEHGVRNPSCSASRACRRLDDPNTASSGYGHLHHVLLPSCVGSHLRGTNVQQTYDATMGYRYVVLTLSEVRSASMLTRF